MMQTLGLPPLWAGSLGLSDVNGAKRKTVHKGLYSLAPFSQCSPLACILTVMRTLTPTSRLGLPASPGTSEQCIEKTAIEREENVAEVSRQAEQGRTGALLRRRVRLSLGFAGYYGTDLQCGTWGQGPGARHTTRKRLKWGRGPAMMLKPVSGPQGDQHPPSQPPKQGCPGG